MKKLLLLLALVSTVASADNWRHHEHGHWERGGADGWTWVAPTIIGGVIGYEIAKPRPPVIVTQQPPIVIQQPPIVQQTNCSPWTEIRNPDGTVTVTRTCAQ